MEWREYPLEEQSARRHTVVGTVRVLPELHSPQLDVGRDILVYLPRSYASRERRYPVVYMQDGQNLFDAATSFGEEWRVDETLEAAEPGVEAIVVGIPNAGEQRCDEYSPWEDPENGGGCGDAYLDFLVDTVKPRVDAAFRTLADREHTGILGSSMGGLISLYALFHRPDTFGFAGVMSPSLWFAGRAVFRFVQSAPVPPGRLYLDVGTGEGAEALDDARRMRRLLLARGFRPGRTLRYLEDPGAGHTEAAWAGRVEGALRFLLG
jgi:predicted alpha/beta superfamily hydrolase